MMLTNISVDQALLKAKSHLKKDEIIEATKLYQSVLKAFPKNIRAQQGLTLLKNRNKTNFTKSPSQVEVDQLINLYNQGQFSLVVEQTNTLLEKYPETFIIWKIIGNSAIQLGFLDNAIEAYSKCIALKPDEADVYINMGIALKDQGKFDEAIEAYQKCISLKPDYAKAYNNMGIALKAQKKLNKAIEMFNQAISFETNNSSAYYNLGNTLRDQNKLEEAIKTYRKCIELNPNFVEAYNNMGISLRGQNKFDEAIEIFEKAITIKTDYAEAYCNLGNALNDLNKLNEAIEAFEKCISLKPDYAVAYENMGISLHELGMFDEAAHAFKKALLIRPDNNETYNNLAGSLQYQDKFEEAIATYAKGLSIQPDDESARAQNLFQQANICDWDITKEENALIPCLGISNQFIPPFAMLSFEDAPERHRLRSEVFVKEKYPQHPLPLPPVPSQKSERIRVGYFSADFHNHATMYLLAKVFAIHDRQKFEIYAYSYGPDKLDQVRQNLIKSVDVFDDVREMSDKDIAMLARQDKLDIAIDLKGHTRHQRLGIFAYRPAPVQISYLGYPGTTGANFIDYIIADQIVIPTDQINAYSEKIIYLPNTYQANDNTRSISEKTGTRKDMGLTENSFVFCCFNSNYKISSVEFDIWMRLLNKVEGSVLWLLKSNQTAEQNLKKEAEKRGVQKDRLVFAEKLPLDEHLARHIHADLFVDTFNVNAHTTASDALWAGLPVVTKLGQSFVARVAGSLLNAVGMPELITENEIDYEELILELATNPDKLKKIKDKLATNRLTKPLFDTETYTKDLENSYHKAYLNYLKGNNPQNIY